MHDGPWAEAFDLMWEAYRAGTIPVGAVVTDVAASSRAGGTGSSTGRPERSRAAHGSTTPK